jgi:hypothetical protein
MNLLLQRLSDNDKSTMGAIYHKEEKSLINFSLEDRHQDVKVKKETRIPAGFYELKIRKEDTPLTIRHREAYGAWFKYHIEITGIANFSGVYFHAGNDESHTDGCILVGNTLNNHKTVQGKPLTSSVDGTRRFYALVYPHLEAGNKAFITIRDEESLFEM